MRFSFSPLLACSVMFLLGCDDGSVNANSHRAPAVEVPTGSLSAGSAEDIRTLLDTPLVDGIKSTFIESADAPLMLLEIDPEHLEPVLLGAPGTGVSAEEAFARHDLQLLIGSGFVSELHSLQPVGLLQLDGATLNPLQVHGYTRILGINDQGMGVVHKEAYQRGLFHSALQVGPGIIEDGALDISERDLQRPRYFRSFIALCNDRWIVGVSRAPAHLRTLGQALLKHFQQQAWQCPEVVNLAGDRQAVTLIRTHRNDIVYHGDPATYKASLLGFRTREPQGNR